MNIFGIKLKELRAAKNLTQKELAKQLNLTDKKISFLECGTTEPNIQDLSMLSKYFDVSTDYLLGLEDDFGNKTNETSELHKAAAPLTSDEREMLALWRELPQDKKESILNIIKK